MAEPPKPPDDDRIEDLLSQLQGIFGRLSTSEDEEARTKIDVPAAKPAEPAPVAAPPQPEPPAPIAVGPDPEPIQTSAAAEPTPPEVAPVEAPPVVEAIPAPVMSEAAPEPPPPPPPPPAAPVAPEAPAMYVPEMPHVAPAPEASTDETIAAVFFPQGRDREAKALAEKLESLTPKFTKVSFRLRVRVQEAYDPKVEWRERFLQQLEGERVRTAFLIVDRSMDDAKRKALSAELERRQIYFQEVPLLAVEKKAFFTDLLLGLIFFFDSIRGTPQA